jgi:hypothetical protein
MYCWVTCRDNTIAYLSTCPECGVHVCVCRSGTDLDESGSINSADMDGDGGVGAEDELELDEVGALFADDN